MSSRLLSLWLLSVVWVSGEEPSLVRVGEAWRYFLGLREPSSLDTNLWYHSDFDDRLWPTGPSGFGYGGIDAATSTPGIGISYRSLYLRRSFHVESPDAIRWLILRVDYRDGFVAYLNGHELTRRNLPGATNAPVPFDLPALPHASGVPEEIDVTAGIAWLQPGENLLAIQGNVSESSSYYYLLNPELLANFTRGPMLQNASTNQIQIVWKTPLPAESLVEYGRSPDLGTTVYDTNRVLTHVVTLNDLTPGTRYYYRATSTAGDQIATGPLDSFSAFRNAGPVSFVVVGDTGYGNAAQYKIAAAMQSAAPELVMHVGDVVYPALTAAQMDLKCFSVYQPQMRSIPFYFAAGNHDYYNNTVDYLDAFYLPTNQVTGTEDFYSFNQGDAHFVVLNTALGTVSSCAPGSPQYQWLEADLAAATQPWKFLFFHNTIHTSGPHRGDDYNANGISDMVELQQSVGGLAGRYQVQMIFTGHDHAYARCGPLNGTHTIVTGGGGAGLYAFSGAWDETNVEYWARYNCVKVTVNGDLLELEALGLEGEIFDRMTIQRTVPPPLLYSAAWHAPSVEASPPDNGAGNILGQRFDFIGLPLRAFCGQFSNLGQLWVNNDDQNLYLGLEGVMITQTQNVVLFLALPQLEGVKNLQGLQGGAVGLESQEVAGLQFWDNLSFTNFTPSVACILGDKFGDSQNRRFDRARSPGNGQGVYQLRPGLPRVEGVRLQQFNLSPEVYGVPEPPNANFIALAIPFSELGALRPGDTIQIGMVTAGTEPSTNSPPANRWLDLGFLGLSLAGGGWAAASLEAVSIELARPPNAADLDSDEDGLRDNWEVAHGLDPGSSGGRNGGAADPDGDGMSNWQEQVAGTDPNDPSSRLRLTSVGLADGRLEFLWDAVVGKRYQLDSSDTAAGPFSPLTDPGLPKTAQQIHERFTQDLSPASDPASARFYRLRVLP